MKKWNEQTLKNQNKKKLLDTKKKQKEIITHKEKYKEMNRQRFND